MGGYNSGRRGGRRSTDSLRALDVNSLQRAGRLKPGQSFGWNWTRRGQVVASINIQSFPGHLNLSYRTRSSDGGWQDMNYPVWLTWTSCNFGGERAWWLCPGLGCGRRVGVLFGGKMYLCRHCQNLAYTSQRETPGDRALRQANRLRERLGWVPGIAHGAGDKPARMHWRTYNRMCLEYYSQSNKVFASMAEQMGLLTGRLEEISLRRA